MGKHTKISSWNFESITRRGREIVEVLKKKAVSIAYVQDTKWTGNSARELGDSYKIFYSGERSKQNGFEIILNAELKAKVIEVDRPNDS